MLLQESCFFQEGFPSQASEPVRRKFDALLGKCACHHAYRDFFPNLSAFFRDGL
jgi:hypothetical protein